MKAAEFVGLFFLARDVDVHLCQAVAFAWDMPIPLMCFLVAASGVKICWVIHSDLGGSLPVALIDRAIPGSVMVASRVSLSSLRITARFITHTNTVCR